jgi:hypothetical protein
VTPGSIPHSSPLHSFPRGFPAWATSYEWSSLITSCWKALAQTLRMEEIDQFSLLPFEPIAGTSPDLVLCSVLCGFFIPWPHFVNVPLFSDLKLPCFGRTTHFLLVPGLSQSLAKLSFSIIPPQRQS